MSTIKTAEDFIDQRQKEIFDLLAPLRSDVPLSKEQQKQLSEKILVADEYAIGIQTLMCEFAKYHVKKALEAALEDVPYGGSDPVSYEDVKHILDSYPESNIQPY